MSKTSCLILQGKKSFSISKLEQLNRAFNKANNLEASLSCFEVYLIAQESDANSQVAEISEIVKGSNELQEFLL